MVILQQTELCLGDRVRLNANCPYKSFIGDEGIVTGLHYNEDGSVNVTFTTDFDSFRSEGWSPRDFDILGSVKWIP